MKSHSLLKSYSPIAALVFVLIILFRLLELFLISLKVSVTAPLVQDEFLGLLNDFAWSGILLLLYFPVFLLLSLISKKLAYYFSLGLIMLGTIIHFLIMKYFLYQLIPLDIFLYLYSLKEVLFTVKTSTESIALELLLLPFLLLILFLLSSYFRKIKLAERAGKLLIFCFLFSMVAFLFIHPFGTLQLNKFSSNKSIYFLHNSLLYLSEEDDDSYSDEVAEEYQKIFDEKQYIGTEFPLLHPFEASDRLGSYFHPFDTAPNIVVLVVEGLNDDYLHPYRGVTLMPFLDSLKKKSLYWSKCFTLGERSFAAIPSVLGSLPYGRSGFTLLDRLPRHLSLVSILNANDYYTSFFYGQGSWFHQKGKFFRLNNVDLIIDNEDYPGEFEKIIVDDFFWGYHDKDLLMHSLEVIDSLPANRRLDVYFTGTTHSPFAIADEREYNKKFSKLIEKTNAEDKEFFNDYRKYFLTIPFADDALREFFAKYKSRPEFKNTIFIITGDHPMTEIPIANSLKRYHVPLLIFSPQLKGPQIFKNMISHLDIYESFLSLLSDYDIEIPAVSSALGDKLLSQREVAKMAFMDDNRDVKDYLSGNYYISGNQLFSVNDDLSIEAIIDPIKLHKLKNELEVFGQTSRYVSVNDRIISDSSYCEALGYELLYSKKGNDTVQFASEYHDLLKMKIPNTEFFLDVSFEFDAEVKDEDFTLVYQLTDSSNKKLFWENTGVNYRDGIFQLYKKFPQQESGDSLINLSLFFWNTKKQDFSYSDLRISLFRP